MSASNHDRSRPLSAANCDELFAALSPHISKLRRHKAQGCCAFFQDGKNRFAYVYHRKRLLHLDVWFAGTRSDETQYSGLLVRPRNPSTGGYGKEFLSRFYLETSEQIQLASDLLWRSAFSSGTVDVQDPGITLPEEVDQLLREGATRQITVNAYERNPEARRRCIAAHGTSCCICEISLGAIYGSTAEGYIHVHHVRPLSEIGEDYIVDPVVDLRPVCPNCHAVLHIGGQCRKIDEVRQLIRQRRVAAENVR